MTRRELQALAELRLKEAQVLLDQQCYEGAYYLAGYAIECALKSCIARQINQYDFPDLKLVRDSYSHDLEKLVSVSGLKATFDHQLRSDPGFAKNWLTVRNWSKYTLYRCD